MLIYLIKLRSVPPPTTLPPSFPTIKKEPIAFYNILPNMFYTDYSMAVAGRGHHSHVTETVTRGTEKTVTESDTYMPLTDDGNLWSQRGAIKESERITQSQASGVFRRAMRLANTLDQIGQKAEAAMLRFDHLFLSNIDRYNILPPSLISRSDL